jgi:hypothetical protein
MEWRPPHRRGLLGIYRVYWWNLVCLELKQDKTDYDRQQIIEYHHDLDQLWHKMSPAEKKDIDPLMELGKDTGGKWIQVKTIICPNCGWVHHIDKDSSGPSRCHMCMRDVAVS